MRWLLALFAAFPLLAHGGVITRTLDFQDNPTILNGIGNFSYGGLRFSPPCGIASSAHGDEIYLQSDLDNSYCEAYDSDGNYLPGQLPNRDFLGTGLPNFYIDRFAKPFTLLGLAGAGHDGTAFSVVSSKGGFFHGEVPRFCCDPEPYVLPWEWFALTGPLWTDITWFTLTNASEGFGWQPHMGWDDIRYSYSSVPEPPPLWLLLTLPLAGLLMNWQHRKVMKRQQGESPC